MRKKILSGAGVLAVLFGLLVAFAPASSAAVFWTNCSAAKSVAGATGTAYACTKWTESIDSQGRIVDKPYDCVLHNNTNHGLVTNQVNYGFVDSGGAHVVQTEVNTVYAPAGSFGQWHCAADFDWESSTAKLFTNYYAAISGGGDSTIYTVYSTPKG